MAMLDLVAPDESKASLELRVCWREVMAEMHKPAHNTQGTRDKICV